MCRGYSIYAKKIYILKVIEKIIEFSKLSLMNMFHKDRVIGKIIKLVIIVKRFEYLLLEVTR
jgi:hypothetical protein